MAPIAIEKDTQVELPISVKSQQPAEAQPQPQPPKIKRQIDLEGGTTTAKYPHYLPTWDPEEKYGPLEPFEYIERGLNADPSFKDLLPEGSTISDLTPDLGSEVHGVQLSKLSNAGKDQLALLIAQRKVVAFRDQDFADLPIQEALDFGGYFGRHHIHPTSGSPEGYPEIHLVHRSKDSKNYDSYFAGKLTSTVWHSDVTYEEQPPGYTFLYVFETPTTGGDTVFSNQVEAYRRLSPGFKQRLHGLKALHSGIKQAEGSRVRGGVVRREPVETEHPLVRTHPVTGEKSLFVNNGFTKNIVGYKQEESENLLKFLMDHVKNGTDFQARIAWKPKTVVIWDNRLVLHSAILDWSSATGTRRHLARITPQAERPYETPYVEEDEASTGIVKN